MMGKPETVKQFAGLLGQFRELVRADWPSAMRLMTYYLNRNWQQFDLEWSSIFAEVWPAPTNDLEYHDHMHRVLEMFFAPLQPELDYPILKEEINLFISKLCNARRQEMRDFASHLTTGRDLSRYQRNLMERLKFVVDNFSALTPGFPILFYTAKNKGDLSQLRIMRDDFGILKGHYLSCFESCHGVLSTVVGLLNINARGSADAFDGGKPSSLEGFNKFPNARKPKFIDATVLPELATRWEEFFDPRMRNAIGHDKVFHDLTTGMLVLDNALPVPYSEFVAYPKTDPVRFLLSASDKNDLRNSLGFEINALARIVGLTIRVTECWVSDLRRSAGPDNDLV